MLGKRTLVHLCASPKHTDAKGGACEAEKGNTVFVLVGGGNRVGERDLRFFQEEQVEVDCRHAILLCFDVSVTSTE